MKTKLPNQLALCYFVQIIIERITGPAIWNDEKFEVDEVGARFGRLEKLVKFELIE